MEDAAAMLYMTVVGVTVSKAVFVVVSETSAVVVDSITSVLTASDVVLEDVLCGIDVDVDDGVVELNVDVVVSVDVTDELEDAKTELDAEVATSELVYIVTE